MKNTISKDAFFNRYDIDIREGRLGGGSFGTVYKAYDNERDETKAIKVSEVKYINNKKFSLQSEFDATADLPVHKNIANYEAVYQIEMPNGLFDYAVMQYYPEGNLKELSQKNDLSLESKQNLIEGLIKGLKYLHDNKRIHRDIKPSNILISERKGVYTAKIADFGLSKIVNAQELEAFTNSFGGGTLEYSSPEQLLGEKLRYNADLWAIGIIAYELLTGKIPFAAKDISGSAEAKRKIIYQNIVNAPIPSLVDTCPAPYNEIIRQCLVKDPKKRMQTADELLSILTHDNTDTQDDDQGTIFLDLDEKKPKEIVIDSSQVNSDKNNFIQKYGKWIIALIGLVLLGAGGNYLINQSPDPYGTEFMETPITTKTEENKDISAILEEDPDSQNDKSIKERMKSIRLQEEKNIWKLVKEDNTVMAYEEYGILYPEGIYAEEAKKIITSLLSSANLDNEESVWAYANKNNSISAYNKYIETFKEGVHINEAKFKVKLLQRKIDDEQWSKIKNSNSLIEFERYLKLFPDGRHEKDAIERSKIIEKDIKISKAHKEAVRINTIEALETFLSKYPQSRYKEEVEKMKKKLIEEINKKTSISGSRVGTKPIAPITGDENDSETEKPVSSPETPILESETGQLITVLSDTDDSSEEE
ncbi:MAG: serine/threonine protein kinase, partial [Saprospiraceae bacterium]